MTGSRDASSTAYGTPGHDKRGVLSALVADRHHLMVRWRPRRRRKAPEVLWSITLGSHHAPTADRVRHVYVGPGGEWDAPDAEKMRIHSDRGGVFLVYLASDDEWVADSLCATVDDAMELARRDYGVRRDEWTPA